MKNKLYKTAAITLLLFASGCSSSGIETMSEAVKGFDLSIMPVSFTRGNRGNDFSAYQKLDGELIFEISHTEAMRSKDWFRYLNLFHEGYATAVYDNKISIFNTEGEVVADLEGCALAGYNLNGQYFSEGLLLLKNGKSISCFTPQGEEKFQIEGNTYSQFRAGYALYSSEQRSDKLGIIDTNGEVLYESQQDEYIPEWYAWVMSRPESYAHPTWFPLYSDGKPVCIIDIATGKRYLEGALDGLVNSSISIFNSDISIPAVDCNDRLVVIDDDKYGLMDLDGNFIIEPQYDYLRNDGEWYVYGLDGVYGWLDKNGKVVIEAQYSTSSDFKRSDLGFAMSDLSRIDKNTFINRKNEVALETEYNIESNFIGDRCLVDLGSEGYSWMNRNGELVGESMFIGDKHEDINRISMGYAIQY